LLHKVLGIIRVVKYRRLLWGQYDMFGEIMFWAFWTGIPWKISAWDSREGKLRVWKLDEPGLGSCPITAFGVSSLGFSGFATRRFVVVRKARKLLD
jgi:hypothetical protein